MSDLYVTVTQAIKIIEAENVRIAKEEGFEPIHLTGKMYFTPTNGAVWFEVADEYNTTSLLSLDFPDRAAYGEKAVSVDDYKEALDYSIDH